MHLTTGAITTVVDRLERAGYATRRRDLVDRRRVLIELTPQLPGRGYPLYQPLFEGTAPIAKSYTDEQLLMMLEFLQRATALVESELAKLEDGGRESG